MCMYGCTMYCHIYFESAFILCRLESKLSRNPMPYTHKNDFRIANTICTTFEIHTFISNDLNDNHLSLCIYIVAVVFVHSFIHLTILTNGSTHGIVNNQLNTLTNQH